MRLFKAVCKVVCILVIISVVVFNANERMNEKVVLTEYTFSHPEVPKAFDGYKIMVISDLHNARFSDMIIKHIENNQPDIIAFTGDIVQLPDCNFSETMKIVEAFADKIPMYAVTGNHESQNEHYWYILDALRYKGVDCLSDYSVRLEKGNDSILLTGIEDPVHDVVSDEQIEKICEEIKSEVSDGPPFSILLNHRADLYPQIKDTGVDLIISGHLHGGIIRLPFVGGIISKNDSLFLPKYEYGYVKEGASAAMIVSGGCDKNPEKKRFMNPPEIVSITLESEVE